MNNKVLVDYNIVIQTISEIVNNDKIYKKGLTLIYELDEYNFNKLNEDIYYKLNPEGNNFKLSDTFEVEISDIIIKFVKKIPN